MIAPRFLGERQSLGEIVGVVVGDVVFDVVAIQLARVRPLRDHSAPIAIHVGENFQSRVTIELGKGDFEIPDSDRTILEIQAHDRRAEQRANPDGKVKRHRREHPHQRRDGKVFDAGAKSAYLTGHRTAHATGDMR